MTELEVDVLSFRILRAHHSPGSTEHRERIWAISHKLNVPWEICGYSVWKLEDMACNRRPFDIESKGCAVTSRKYRGNRHDDSRASKGAIFHIQPRPRNSKKPGRVFAFGQQCDAIDAVTVPLPEGFLRSRQRLDFVGPRISAYHLKQTWPRRRICLVVRFERRGRGRLVVNRLWSNLGYMCVILARLLAIQVLHSLLGSNVDTG